MPKTAIEQKKGNIMSNLSLKTPDTFIARMVKFQLENPDSRLPMQAIKEGCESLHKDSLALLVALMSNPNIVIDNDTIVDSVLACVNMATQLSEQIDALQMEIERLFKEAVTNA